MGGSAAEKPVSPDEQPVPGLRASDAEREQVAARLRDEFVAGRLSHDTFLQRMDLVLRSRRRAELPPVVADLPVSSPQRSLTGWLRGLWPRAAARGAAPDARVSERPRGAASGTVSPRGGPARARTTSMGAAADGQQPLEVRFPRGGGSHFSIGRDAGCDLAIPDMTVSRRHAQLERTADGWLLSDLESTNGTRVNGWRVRGKVPVRPGDRVSFGDLETVLLHGDDTAV